MAVRVTQGWRAVVLLHGLLGGFCPVAAKEFLTAFLSQAAFCACRGLTENVPNCVKCVASTYADAALLKM